MPPVEFPIGLIHVAEIAGSRRIRGADPSFARLPLLRFSGTFDTAARTIRKRPGRL